MINWFRLIVKLCSLNCQLSSLIKASTKEKLNILGATNLMERFKLAQPLLTRQIEVYE